jgi:AbiV family abortive infection protein
MQPKTETLLNSISETIDNGKQLLEDAKLLFDYDRYSTALALAVLAQEEFAKAFLLQLVSDEALPWLPQVRTSLARHQCKHLLAIVMEWLPNIDWCNYLEHSKQDRERHQAKMAWYQRKIDRYKQGILLPDPTDPEPVEPPIGFPGDVADALNIYRHEEIERLTESGRVSREPDWSKGEARKIAGGALDRKKQSALYVAITRTGAVGFHPRLITREEATEAIQRAEQLSEDRDTFSGEYKKLKEIMPIVFSNLKSESTAS